ncbi:MAG: hypothetical protein SFV55_20350 [Haliscomenobacter sp.]|uniref:hypothetical protein n=1 Tax=Haliscomenobacter sp. TaxID=2717303 RepID=UPI0029B6DE59|nr:hypothetical protein [Haliscomenobacter sp.]MDX2070792.1 hypothetical protein [Haliscomenobacter sp.]
MAEITENNSSVIQQKDPFFAERPHLDFQVLRREGLKHIGELSGKIWTDHNAHDPGITILEALCYALVDLGYRTTLPIADLLASGKNGVNQSEDFPEDDNFFSPLEILTCNPTTILDYRKLLLEVKGVRNAWLEPVKDAHLYLNPVQEEQYRYYQLSCEIEEQKSLPIPISLNGLYHVLIEKEPDADSSEVHQAVQKILSSHRNLCEDFQDITILCPLEVGICADVEIEKNVDVPKVYEAILKAIKAYISPEIQFYTLPQLLNKGKAIEDVFAGRPFLSESYGFVDTTELENLPLRKELYASDLYQAILNIEGVISIRNLSFQTENTRVGLNANIQRLPIFNGEIAQFTLDRNCIQLRSGQVNVQLDKAKVHKGLTISNKSKTGRDNLDLPIPEGVFHPELAEYYSIQNDFPSVYGIGAGGLPEDATPLRKTQTLQLKGYLLFYDQLLANYLEQMANLRNLFSLKQESKRDPASRHTYFSQQLDDVPGIEQLLQIYAAKGLPDGCVIAVPVANDNALCQKLQQLVTNPRNELRVEDSCGTAPGALAHFALPNSALQEIYVQQSIREIAQGDFSVEIHEDKAGHFFVLRFTQVTEWVLISYSRYRNAMEAQEAANFAGFLATMPDYYQKSIHNNDQNTLDYQFDLVYNPVAYADYLQHLLENEQLYAQRREAFLDHLLARFASQFTDYALLRFGAVAGAQADRNLSIEDKSRFLDHFDDTSRNRGRAFDYLQPSWGAPNVSGYEKRITLLSGLSDWTRRSLCKFEVVQSFRIVLPDLQGRPWLSSIAAYPSAQDVLPATLQFREQLRHPEAYGELQRRFMGFDPSAVGRMFAETPSEENIIVSEYHYALQLKGSGGEKILESKKQDYSSTPSASKAIPVFLNEINKGQDKVLNLSRVGEKSQTYLDLNQLQYQVETLITYKWRLYDEEGVQIATANTAFPEETAALADFARIGDFSRFITKEATAFQWSINPSPGVSLIGVNAYTNEIEAQRAWLRCKAIGQDPKNYTVEPTGQGGTLISLKNEKGLLLAQANIPEDKKIAPEKYIKAASDAFGKKNTRVQYQQIDQALGWQLSNKSAGVLMTSFVLYTDVVQAISDLRDAVAAAQTDQNYFAAGTEDNPEYRVLLRDAGGQFLASTPEPFADAPARDKALKALRKTMKQLQAPIQIREEPRQYRWILRRASNSDVLLQATQPLDSENAANLDFEHKLQLLTTKQPQSFIAQSVYSIELLPIPFQYRFVYSINSPEGNPLPLLQSEQPFATKSAAELAYPLFVRSLPNLQLQNNGVTDGERVVAQLIDANADSQQKVAKLLNYMREHHRPVESVVQEENAKWIYRLINKDFPVAKSKECYGNKDAAEHNLGRICSFDPYPLDPKKQVIRIICPTLDPGRFHYALCLTDDQGVEFVFLISYVGYDSRELALEAARSNWLKIIELATESENYGDNKLFSLREIYSTGSNACADNEPYLAVIPSEFKMLAGPTVEKAVKLAQRYPIRISYKNDKNGTLTSIPEGFRFQGFDLSTQQIVWQSTKVFVTAEEAIAAYRLFVIVLGNPNSCRIVCENGQYCIHLLEILAESREFNTEAEAWNDKPKSIRDACGNRVCQLEGVRLFAEAATEETAFIPLSEGECYRFMVVDKSYHVANHTCVYPNPKERDQALNEMQKWALSLECKRQVTHYKGRIRFYIGDGYYLDSIDQAKPTDVDQAILEWMYFAVDGGNINENDGRWELRNPLEDDTVMAIISREEGDIVKEDVQLLARQYPVFKKGDAYCFRLYYPGNGDVLDQKVSICGCKEPAVETSVEPKFRGQTYLFESAHCYPCREAAEQAYFDFCNLLKDPSNYQSSAESGIGPYTISIINPAKVLAHHPNCHPDLSSAMQAAERVRSCLNDEGMHLLEHILLRPKTKTGDRACACLLPVCPDIPCELEWEEDLNEPDPCAEQDSALKYIPGSDPYSFWATVVLPGWQQRFKSAEARYFYKEMLYREVPAMVGLNILWLSPQQMCKFETAYQNWLDWYRNLDPKYIPLCDPQINPLCDLVDCFKKLEDDPLCQITETTAAECACLHPPKVPGDPCIEKTDHLFWIDCPPVNQPVGSNVDTIPEEVITVVSIPDAISESTVPQLATAIREAITQRAQQYQLAIQAITDNNITSSEGFQRALFFVNNPPSLAAYTQLVKQILQKDLGRKGTTKHRVFSNILQQASWYLFDQLLQEHPNTIPAETKAALAPVLASMQAKGINMEDLAKGWQAENLAKLLAAKAYNKFLKLLKSN